MRRLVDERDFPVDEMRFFASHRSAGSKLPWRGAQVLVEDADGADFTGLEFALFSCGKTTSLWLAPRVAAAGAVVIDNSSAWRMDPEVPLVVSEVNPEALASIPKGIVANPNCTTMVAMPVLKPLDAAAGLRRTSSRRPIRPSRERGSPVSPSSTRRSVLCADRASAHLRRAAVVPRPAKFAHRSLQRPAPGGRPRRGRDRRDRRGAEVPQREPQDPRPARTGVVCSCVRVPVFTGHSLALALEFARALSPEPRREILAASPGVVLADVPTPLQAAGADPVLRRADPARPDGRERPRAVRLRRQPAQGRRPQRRRDRRDPRRAWPLERAQ